MKPCKIANYFNALNIICGELVIAYAAIVHVLVKYTIRFTNGATHPKEEGYELYLANIIISSTTSIYYFQK